MQGVAGNGFGLIPGGESGRIAEREIWKNDSRFGRHPAGGGGHQPVVQVVAATGGAGVHRGRDSGGAACVGELGRRGQCGDVGRQTTPLSGPWKHRLP